MRQETTAVLSITKTAQEKLLHYEKDPDDKEVAVWTTYNKNGHIIKKRREK